MNAQIVSIPDANFKAKLLASAPENTIVKDVNGHYIKIDANNNGEIEVVEAEQAFFIDVNNIGSIVSLEGINSFTNLYLLNCTHNVITTIDLNLPNLRTFYCNYNLLQTIDLSHLPQLKTLYLGWNQISMLDVSSLTNLETLICPYNTMTQLNFGLTTNVKSINCSFNQLASLDITHLSNLQILDCNDNLLTALEVSQCPAIYRLLCQNNQIDQLAINSLPQLQSFYCQANPISVLDFSNAAALYDLRCENTLLTTIDVSHSTVLNYLYCSSNALLQSIFMKNGKNETIFNFATNPNLEYICADESQLSAIETKITTYGYTNCHTNSYCSFTQGGAYYTIQGNTTYDNDLNGCDASDLIYPHAKILFSNGVNNATIISDASGNYHYAVQAGTHTLTPILENPLYFTISPASSSATFPADVSPFTQDFCITPNGTHNDLEVTILPLFGARPGFNTGCKIIYKNKGTHAQSGTVSLNFDNALDLISSTPAVASQSANLLTWNFANLQPFESAEILLVFNLNSPIETPPLNPGDILIYTATVTGATDETPSDNISTVHQMVVSAIDPNDKICLEGSSIAPEMIGKYVHYIIHFENNGTAAAQNIVVKDTIDTTKFDLSSLIPIDVSQSFTTKISEPNTVEFIFENINLPFDDANNDGYVAFKIKTQPTLVPGDSLSNDAKIYFDYNAPIQTNTAVTTIQLLGIPDFECNTYFTLSPNPTKEILTIDSKQGLAIDSICIYNQLGQLILTEIHPNKTIDVSGLPIGNYFLRILSDKGQTSAKFIKQ